jgi:hypothetical protein
LACLTVSKDGLYCITTLPYDSKSKATHRNILTKEVLKKMCYIDNDVCYILGETCIL